MYSSCDAQLSRPDLDVLGDDDVTNTRLRPMPVDLVALDAPTLSLRSRHSNRPLDCTPHSPRPSIGLSPTVLHVGLPPCPPGSGRWLPTHGAPGLTSLVSQQLWPPKRPKSLFLPTAITPLAATRPPSWHRPHPRPSPRSSRSLTPCLRGSPTRRRAQPAPPPHHFPTGTHVDLSSLLDYPKISGSLHPNAYGSTRMQGTARVVVSHTR